MTILENLEYLQDLIVDFAALTLRYECREKAQSLLSETGYATSEMEYGLRRIGFQLADTIKEAKRLDRLEQEQRETEMTTVPDVND